jgi:hypothetical protein
MRRVSAFPEVTRNSSGRSTFAPSLEGQLPLMLHLGKPNLQGGKPKKRFFEEDGYPIELPSIDGPAEVAELNTGNPELVNASRPGQASRREITLAL